MKKYDVILIGTGAANIIADAAQLAGKKVALIERLEKPALSQLGSEKK